MSEETIKKIYSCCNNDQSIAVIYLIMVFSNMNSNSEGFEQEIRDYIEERNRVLKTGDVDQVLALHKKWNPDIKTPERHVMEVAMHKVRTVLASLTEQERADSVLWLKSRGLKPMSIEYKYGTLFKEYIDKH